jgi:hypothetical protein
MRYLAESSFWLYLAHLPVIIVIQTVLLPVNWPTPVKFLIVAAVAIGVSLLSYEAIVRRSLVGEIVNGARKRTVKPGLLGPEFGWVATLAVAAVLLAAEVWSLRTFLWKYNLYEEIPGHLYRSARFSDERLVALIGRKGLRTVVTFTDGNPKHFWYIAQKRVCRARGVDIYPIDLRPDRLPSREVLVQLLDVLDHCPRPILVESHRGIDETGFTTAVALLLAGLPPRTALEQFAMKYGQFGGAEHSPLGLALVGYCDWLRAHHWPHTPERFRMWAAQEYLVHSFPAPPRDVRNGGNLIARGGDAPVVAR